MASSSTAKQSFTLQGLATSRWENRISTGPYMWKLFWLPDFLGICDVLFVMDVFIVFILFFTPVFTVLPSWFDIKWVVCCSFFRVGPSCCTSSLRLAFEVCYPTPLIQIETASVIQIEIECICLIRTHWTCACLLSKPELCMNFFYKAISYLLSIMPLCTLHNISGYTLHIYICIYVYP